MYFHPIRLHSWLDYFCFGVIALRAAATWVCLAGLRRGQTDE
jgi:hypothetical protein